MTRPDLLRAVFEGVVYSHRTHIDRLRVHNPRLDRLRLAGGAARSAVWVQMFADVLAMPVEVIGAEELGAKGAAMAAAVAAGVYADFREAAGAMVSIAAAVEPESSTHGGVCGKICTLPPAGGSVGQHRDKVKKQSGGIFPPLCPSLEENVCCERLTVADKRLAPAVKLFNKKAVGNSLRIARPQVL